MKRHLPLFLIPLRAFILLPSFIFLPAFILLPAFAGAQSFDLGHLDKLFGDRKSVV